MIEINNLTAVSINEESLKKVCRKVLEGENKKEMEVSIVLVGPGRMRELNKKYRKKDRATDVLSFPDDGNLLHFDHSFPLEVRAYNNFGEIVICPREVNKNAKKYKFSFEKELARVLIHGVLHLLGEDHEISAEEARVMEGKERHYYYAIKS